MKNNITEADSLVQCILEENLYCFYFVFSIASTLHFGFEINVIIYLWLIENRDASMRDRLM